MILSNRVWQDWRYFTAFGFGLGLSRFAPGTFGTLAALPLYALMSDLNPYLYAAIVFILFCIGTYVAEQVSIELGEQDYSGIVIDEVVGYLITLFACPKGGSWLIAGFLLFRFFDILKPMPIKWIDAKVKGGLGVMLDDVFAGLMAFVVLQGWIYWGM